MESVKYCDVVLGQAPATTCRQAQQYMNGTDVPQDYCKAVALFRQAMDEGDDMAACYLGECYFSGAGVKKDYAMALHYYEQSNTVRARSRIRRFFRDGEMCQAPRFDGFRGLEQAAQRNVPGACITMGNLYFLGKVGYRDFEEGVRWYRLAGEDPEARFCLGYAHAVGAGTEQDFDLAEAHFRAAAKQGILPAAFNLMVCSRLARGEDADVLTKEEWQQVHSFRRTQRTANNRIPYGPEQLWVARDMDAMTKVITQTMSEETDTESEV